MNIPGPTPRTVLREPSDNRVGWLAAGSGRGAGGELARTAIQGLADAWARPDQEVT